MNNNRYQDYEQSMQIEPIINNIGNESEIINSDDEEQLLFPDGTMITDNNDNLQSSMPLSLSFGNQSTMPFIMNSDLQSVDPFNHNQSLFMPINQAISPEPLHLNSTFLNRSNVQL